LLERFDEAYNGRQADQLIECDIRFHHTIVSACRHSRLLQMHQQLDAQVGAMYMTISNQLPFRFHKVVSNHRILLNALMTSDPEIVQQEFRSHYFEPLNELERQFKN
jgi:DNA-binding GntR family transcriptional regulator